MSDPVTIGGVVALILTGVGNIIVVGFKAWADAKERIITAGDRKKIIEQTAHIAQKTEDAQDQLAAIKQTTEESAKNVDGNLAKVREDLARQMEHSKALQSTIDVLVGIVESLGVSLAKSTPVVIPANDRRQIINTIPVVVEPIVDPDKGKKK